MDPDEIVPIVPPESIGSVKEWNNATQAYYFDQYRFRGFESLHAYNILALERQLCDLEAQLVSNSLRPLYGPALEGDDTRKLRNLLHLHG
jgi:hypothetical protein